MQWKKFFYFASVALVLFVSDALLKAYVDSNIIHISAALPIYPYGGIEVFHDWHGIDFSIVHVANKGAAWGMFASLQQYLLYVRMAIIGGLLTYLLFVNASGFRKFCLTVILAGALGNILDYFIYGHVIDMFLFSFWGYNYPVFNIADSAIFTGIAMLMLQSITQKGKEPKRAFTSEK
ncbi:MAG: signal peptidase II [Chlamydiota bacterium]